MSHGHSSKTQADFQSDLRSPCIDGGGKRLRARGSFCVSVRSRICSWGSHEYTDRNPRMSLATPPCRAVDDSAAAFTQNCLLVAEEEAPATAPRRCRKDSNLKRTSTAPPNTVAGFAVPVLFSFSSNLSHRRTLLQVHDRNQTLAALRLLSN